MASQDARKRGGTGGLGVRAPEEPTCQDSLPRMRQFGLSGRGRSGRQIARRRHCREAVGERRGARRWPRVRASVAPRSLRRWRRLVKSGGGAAASAPGLRPAWFEPGPAPGPPRVGRETEAGAGTNPANGRARPLDHLARRGRGPW